MSAVTGLPILATADDLAVAASFLGREGLAVLDQVVAELAAGAPDAETLGRWGIDLVDTVGIFEEVVRLVEQVEEIPARRAA